MPLNRNTLMRIRTIDSCLHRRQRRWTIEDLRKACEDALYDYEGIESVSLRTVQRDIELMRGDKLGYFAPIVVREKKYYEYEDPDYSITKLPLSKQDLTELSSAVDIIKHYNGFTSMQGQEDVLTRIQDQINVQGNNQQIVFIETNRQLKGLHFLSQLYDHILKKEPLVLQYQSFRSSRDGAYNLSPYFLKEYNDRWFLISYWPKKRKILTLALDRIISVKVDKKHGYIENTFFEPATYLSEMMGITRDLDSKTCRVLLKFDAHRAPYILTKPLHCSQQVISQEANGSLTIALDVILNNELETKILSFGSQVEVLSPKKLRQSLADQHIIAAEKYSQPPALP